MFRKRCLMVIGVLAVLVMSGAPTKSHAQSTPAKTIQQGGQKYHDCPDGKTAYFEPIYNGAHISGGRAWCYTPGSNPRNEAFKPDNKACYYTFAIGQGSYNYRGNGVDIISN